MAARTVYVRVHEQGYLRRFGMVEASDWILLNVTHYYGALTNERIAHRQTTDMTVSQASFACCVGKYLGPMTIPYFES